MYACMYVCLPGEPWPLLVGHVPLNPTVLRAGAAGRVPTAVVSWFYLTLCDGVQLSSSPESGTHWRQLAHVIPARRRRPLGACDGAFTHKISYLIAEEESWVGIQWDSER